jgi:PAS domain S-box-containing protein
VGETVADTRERAAALARRTRNIETLYRVADAVAREDDLREIVQLVTDETTAITGARFGAFFYNVVRRGDDVFSLYTISGAPLSKFERFPMPRATDIFRPTYEGTEIVRIDDVLADPRFGRNPPYNGLPPGHLPVRSYLAVPVFGRDGAVVGGLFFGHEQVGVFTEEHEQIAVGIATQAGVAIDKARLLQAERDARAAAEARADAAAAVDVVEDGVVMVDRGGHIRLWNRAAAAISGLAAETVLGRTIGEAVPGWERIALDVPLGDADDPVAPRTLPLDTLDGREVWLSVYGVAFGDGIVYAFRDVTAERELDLLRADVIATVSHELRTPIAAVYGAVQTLRRRELDSADAAQLLEIVDGESRRLTALVDEILVTSQIDSDRLRLERDDVDPARAVAAVVDSATVVAGAASISVDLPESPPHVAADEEKLRQVLANLVENALKYGRSPDGQARVELRVRSGGGTVRFEVADGGPGVPRHAQALVFEKFYRLDPHLRRGVRGTGLGLYICRELVRRMHGTIGVESAEGRGATFWLELPRS